MLVQDSLAEGFAFYEGNSLKAANDALSGISESTNAAECVNESKGHCR